MVREVTVVLREVTMMLQVMVVAFTAMTEAAKVNLACIKDYPSLSPPPPYHSYHVTSSRVCLNVQVGATHPSTTHPHPLPDAKLAGTPGVSVHALWTDTDVCMTSVDQPTLCSTGPNRPGVAGQHGASTKMRSHREY